MSKILKLQNNLRVQWQDNNTGKYNETSYFGTEINDDGTNIIIVNASDPNFADVTIPFVAVSQPLFATITELRDNLRCTVLEKTGRLLHFPESDNIIPAPCLGLQNVGDGLYWNGTLLGAGGSGGTSTGSSANNGLSVNGGIIQLGGAGSDLIQNTAVEAGEFNLMFRGIDPFSGRDARIAINATSGAAKMASDSDGVHIGWDAAINKVLIQSGALENVTITNDGTNNVILDPNGYSVTHNTSIYHTFNDGAGLASQFGIDNAELAMTYTNFSTGSNTSLSLGQGSWNAGYQNANISTAILDDNRAQLQLQSGSSSEISKALLETNQVTIENTDGTSTASTVSAATSGVVQTIINHTTNDYTRIRVLNSGIDLSCSINGGNISTLSVTSDAIYVDGGMAYGITAISGATSLTLPTKKTFYFIDTNVGAGTVTFTIPVENCLPGYVMTIKDEYGNASSRTINIDTALGQMELGLTQTINTDFGYRTFVYSGSTWLTVAQA